MPRSGVMCHQQAGIATGRTVACQMVQTEKDMSQDLISGESPRRPERIREDLERTKRMTPHGREYWSARDLAGILGYVT